jgi:catechol 2,3-dioxygenase-like lactoylglutathione lyase family enzyme
MLDHFNIRTRKLDATVRFYQDILGLESGDRPNFSFPGAWMYSEGRPVVHLVDISPTDEQQKPDSGVVHHVAFASRDFNGMKGAASIQGNGVRNPPGAGWRVVADFRPRPQWRDDRTELRGRQGAGLSARHSSPTVCGRTGGRLAGSQELEK